MKNSFENLSFTRTLENGDQLTFSAIAQGEGPIVLCLHGFPDHALSYRHQLPAFSNAGFRAIAITLRGYEPSSIPSDGDFALLRIAEDVIHIIKQLQEQDSSIKKVHLVGHDWGSAVAYLVSALSPDLLYSSTNMAVPHLRRFSQQAFKKYPKQMKLSWYMFFFQIRGISDYMVERNNFKFIRWLWQSWCPTWTLPENDLDQVITTLSKPGVKKAALGYYRAMFNLTSKATKETAIVASKIIDVPTLAITGSDDGCIDSEVFQNLMLKKDFSNTLRVEEVVGAGHFLHQEKPNELNALMLDWFAENAE